MSQRLTPVDILNLRFRRRMNGYAIAEVDDFVRRVASDMESLLTEGAGYRERIASLEREIAQYRTIESTMRDALVLAQKTADDTRAAARAQADASLQEARARVAEMDGQIEQLRQERRRLVRDLRAQLMAQLDWLNQELGAETVAVVSGSDSLPTVETAFPSRERQEERHAAGSANGSHETLLSETP